MQRQATALKLGLALAALAARAGAEEQQLAPLGDLPLEHGGVIRDCVLGYRTFGSLNTDKSNAVLFPTAFGWRSDLVAGLIGPGKLIDSGRYYVIAVDSLADGISTSPSNSKTQAGGQFPQFSLRDMVNAEHKLVVDALHLPHLRAVMGFSMGGTQAFQWAVTFPGSVDKIIAILATPQLTSYDLLLWRTMLLALDSDPDWQQGRYTHQPALHLMNMVQMLVLQTPQFVVTKTPRAEYEKFESQLIQGADDLDANDTRRQIQALLSADVAAPFGGSLPKAAATVRAAALVVVNKQDHLMNPLPASEFARMLHGKLIELDNNCGHRAYRCDMQQIGAAVTEFLEEPQGTSAAHGS